MKQRIRDVETLSAAIRKQRRIQGITQQDLADLSGVSVRFLGDLERGKTSCEIGLTLQVASTLGIIISLREPGDDS